MTTAISADGEILRDITTVVLDIVDNGADAEVAKEVIEVECTKTSSSIGIVELVWSPVLSSNISPGSTTTGSTAMSH